MAISMDRAKPGGLRYPILKHTQMIPACDHFWSLETTDSGGFVYFGAEKPRRKFKVTEETTMKEPTRASQGSPSTWRSNEYMVSKHNPIDYEILDILY